MSSRLAILAGLLTGVLVAALVLGGLFALTPGAAEVTPTPAIASAEPTASAAPTASPPTAPTPATTPTAAPSSSAVAPTATPIQPGVSATP